MDLWEGTQMLGMENSFIVRSNPGVAKKFRYFSGGSETSAYKAEYAETHHRECDELWLVTSGLMAWRGWADPSSLLLDRVDSLKTACR
jgi:hypothetical protein